MSVTIDQARDQMLAVFKAAWDPTGHPARYDDVAGDEPSGVAAWARVLVRHAPGGRRQATLSGEAGARRFRATGTVIAQVMAEFGKGLNLADSLAKIVKDAFEGKTTSGGVIFRNVSSAEVGKSGQWWQTNITADFEYDEIR
jgi:hypothetical protein